MTELSLIKNAHLTEKASARSVDADHPVHTFVVAKESTKGEIKREVIRRYGVTPVKINLIKAPAKLIVYRGRVGRKPGFKKALVFLNQGEKINYDQTP